MNFVIALVIASFLTIGGSLVWPRLTSAPRPPVLQQVRDTVLKTPIGKQSAAVLGVSDESKVRPVTPGQILAGAVGNMEQMVQKRITDVIVKNAVNQLQSQLDKLSPDQQQQIKEQICKPQAQ